MGFVHVRARGGYWITHTGVMGSCECMSLGHVCAYLFVVVPNPGVSLGCLFYLKLYLGILCV